MRAIGGGHHQAEAMITSGGTYDRLWIQAPLSGINGKVDKLTLSNLYTKGGICKLSNINAGTVKILLNEVGDATGFATKGIHHRQVRNCCSHDDRRQRGSNDS